MAMQESPFFAVSTGVEQHREMVHSIDAEFREYLSGLRFEVVLTAG